MSTRPKISGMASEDQLLRRTMCIVGLTLLVVSLFFLYRDVGIGAGDNVFFALCALLGSVTYLAGRQTKLRSDRRQQVAREQRGPRAPRSKRVAWRPG